ncbi:hypothetical protein TBLA_0C06800 [Henningerozyma blattae CBS 6284]|uniref:Uncharacterized protein n=1 Tax=Henningerozyma blattae (strain ATCC 34711 / CBS 6284 / DSM 70876 / NBRC 10599 / NRRL Y-10934 / UCD 77-7) TaxID=1071380 RepID=I2H270_HENB6|nr:hypothetical protein TBLA_0C06800 [Tetrapisispora blattae CBS 6284]CCH60472.1 hypothetical protein TBLA_0C06800 [Tetrapisispora blattae CBS 6284]
MIFDNNIETYDNGISTGFDAKLCNSNGNVNKDITTLEDFNITDYKTCDEMSEINNEENTQNMIFEKTNKVIFNSIDRSKLRKIQRHYVSKSFLETQNDFRLALREVSNGNHLISVCFILFIQLVVCKEIIPVKNNEINNILRSHSLFAFCLISFVSLLVSNFKYFQLRYKLRGEKYILLKGHPLYFYLFFKKLNEASWKLIITLTHILYYTTIASVRNYKVTWFEILDIFVVSQVTIVKLLNTINPISFNYSKNKQILMNDIDKIKFEKLCKNIETSSYVNKRNRKRIIESEVLIIALRYFNLLNHLPIQISKLAVISYSLYASYQIINSFFEYFSLVS